MIQNHLDRQFRSHLASTVRGFRHKGDVHGNMMLIAWIVFAHLGLWSQYFRHKQWGLTVHGFFMTIMTALVWISGFFAIGTFGLVNQMPTLHIVLGIMLLVLITVVWGGGVLSYKLILFPKLKPSLVFNICKIHRYAGFLTVAIAIIQLLTTIYTKLWLFLLILIGSLLSIGIFYYLKFRGRKYIHSTSMTPSQTSSYQPSSHTSSYLSLKQIKNGKDLSIYKNNYFIFADKLYDINNVIGNHPGGWSVIKSIEGTQVDRYLYGTQPLQNYSKKGDMILHNHYQDSLQLAGPPIAILYNIPPYTMDQINVAVIDQITKPCRHQGMYAVYLKSKNNPFQFRGYTQLNQLGKYYAVNIGPKLTRLYSCLNTIHPTNLILMSKIVGRQFWQNNKIVSYNGQVQTVQNSNNTVNINTIPLYIKKYPDGKLTQQLLSGHYTDDIKISKPRGRGMYLDQLPPGLILMFAGGTGLNPFADTIDVLFKEVLLSDGHQLAQQIANQCPLATKKLLNKFTFVLFISVKDINQVHPITLYQCNILANRKLLTVFIKSDAKDNSSATYPFIKRVNQRFDTMLNQWVRNSYQISHVYLCGPPAFTWSIVQHFPQFNLEPYKYKVL